MSSLKYWHEYLLKRVKLIDEFVDLYPDANVFEYSLQTCIHEYINAYNEYYKFKPVVKTFFSLESTHDTLEKLRNETIKKQNFVNDRLDDAGFNIIRFLGNFENQHGANNINQEIVIVSQALGEQCSKYLSAKAQKAWLNIMTPLLLPDQDAEIIDPPLYAFSKIKINLAPANEERQNNNNAM